MITMRKVAAALRKADFAEYKVDRYFNRTPGFTMYLTGDEKEVCVGHSRGDTARGQQEVAGYVEVLTAKGYQFVEALGSVYLPVAQEVK